jgi:geranylgeranyl pyrophosphate synthase
VEQALRDGLAGEGLLGATGRHLVLAPGAKRARPWLSALWGHALGAPARGVVDVAVAVELIHSASLLHDDVVDGGVVRRGRPTANVQYGAAAAVLSGDVLLARALSRLRPHGPLLAERAIDVVAEMSAAAVREVEMRRRLELGADEWRAVAVGKTGALFGLCGDLLGRLVAQPHVAARLDAVGRALGVAFQAKDDLLDLSDPGQGRFSDLHEGNPSLPVLLAAREDRSLGEALLSAWARDRVDPVELATLGERVLRTAAFDRSLALIRAEVSRAMAALAELPTGPEVRLVSAWAEDLAVDPRSASRERGER